MPPSAFIHMEDISPPFKLTVTLEQGKEKALTPRLTKIDTDLLIKGIGT